MEDAYRVLGWQTAVKETARLINKVAETSKQPRVPDAVLWAVRRAKKVWSKTLTVDNSLTLSPNIKELTHHTNMLQRCVASADHAQKGYSESLSMTLTSTALVAWAMKYTAGRAAQTWEELAQRLISKEEQAAEMGCIRKHSSACEPTRLHAVARSIMLHYRAVRENTLQSWRKLPKVQRDQLANFPQPKEGDPATSKCIFEWCNKSLNRFEHCGASPGYFKLACCRNHYRKAQEQLVVEEAAQTYSNQWSVQVARRGQDDIPNT